MLSSQPFKPVFQFSPSTWPLLMAFWYGLLILPFEASFRASSPIQPFEKAFQFNISGRPFQMAFRESLKRRPFDPAFWVAVLNLEKKYVVINKPLQCIISRDRPRFFDQVGHQTTNFFWVDYYISNYKNSKKIFFFEKLKIMIFFNFTITRLNGRLRS